jgi:hypothetical protein
MGLTDKERKMISDCCDKPDDCKWGGVGGCGYEGRKHELSEGNMSGEYKMPEYDKEVQREKEWDAWDGFKRAVQKCLELQFSEKQLLAHINVRYCEIKGQVRGEGLHDVNV